MKESTFVSRDPSLFSAVKSIVDVPPARVAFYSVLSSSADVTAATAAYRS